MVRIKWLLIGMALSALALAGCNIQEILDLLGGNGHGDGPGLAIQSPERGTWTESYSGTVQGSIAQAWSSVASVKVNGNQVTPQEDLTFRASVNYEFGINRIETIATSTQGYSSTDRRCVMAGSFLPKDVCAEEVIAIRLNQGTWDAISEAATTTLDDMEISDYVPSTLLSQKSSGYELHVYLVDPAFDNVALDFGTTANGGFAATALLEGLDIPIKAEGVVSSKSYSVETGVSVERISLSVLITPSLEDGVFATVVGDVDLTTQGLQLDLPDWMNEAAQHFEIDINNLLQVHIEDAAEKMIEKVAGLALDSCLNDMAIDYRFGLQGTSYHFSAKPYDLKVDAQGATLTLKTTLQPDQWKIGHQGKGSLMFDYAKPNYAAGSDMIVSLSADFLNQALYAFWGGGLMQIHLTAENMTLPELNLPFIPKELPDFHIVIKGMLPPAVVPGKGRHLFDLQAGDIEIKLYAGEPATNNLVLAFYAGFDAGLSFTISDQNALSPTFEDLDSWFDYVYPPIPYTWENSLENFVKILLQRQLLPLLEQSVRSIQLPHISGVNLSNIQIEKGGAEGGFVNASAEVSFSP